MNNTRDVPEYMPHAGNPDAPCVVVCDSPTLNQWRQGVPIGGPSFNLWSETAIQWGFGKDDFFFISPCAPIPDQVEGSDKREKAFVDLYRGSLRKTIAELTNAKLFIFLGKTAGYALTHKPVKITKQRGVVRLAEGLSRPVLPMLSPGHVLRRPENREIFDADMHMLRILCEGGWNVHAAAEAVAETNYEWRDDISDVIDLHPVAMSIDTEGVGVKWYQPETRILTAQFSYQEGHAIMIPLAKWENSAYPGISQRRLYNLRQQFKLLCEDPAIKKSAHNMKFDHHMLRRCGIETRGWAVDTQLYAFFADENMQEKSQDECVRRWVPEMAGYADSFNADPVHVGKSRMDLVPPDKMLKYCCGDADGNLRLAKRLVPLVRQDTRQMNCYTRVQFPAMRAFMDVVEPAGIKIDTEELAKLKDVISERAETEYQELIAAVPPLIKRKYLAKQKGRETIREVLSFSRDNFVRDILFTPEGFNLKPLVFTPTTRKLKPDEQVASVSTKTHLPYFDDNEFVVKLMSYQKLAKLQNTYIGELEHVEFNARNERFTVPSTGFWKYLDENGFIHPSFILHRTVTGRTASADPNGQNFPKRGALAKQYRKIFVPRPGYTFIECDLSQAELRIAAWMSGDPTMLEIYRSGGDIHMATALIVSNLSAAQFAQLPKPIQKEYRQKAKAVNFGFLYGMGWKKFMAYAKTDYQVVFTEREAKMIRFNFFRKYRRLEGWHAAMRDFVREYGYVRALHGAKRNLPNIRSSEEYIRNECERQAINSPVQRFGSDLGLMAMGRLCRDCDPELMRPVAFIHDALVCEVRNDYIEAGARALRFYMESNPLKNWFNLDAPLPIKADVSIGTNLSEMEERTDKDTPAELFIHAEAPEWWNYTADGYEKPPKQYVYQTT